MAQFLRDKRISNVTLEERGLNEIFDIFDKRIEALPTLPNDQKEAYLAYAIIRIDGKGYQVYSRHELLRYFYNAKSVERIIVNLQSPVAQSSNNNAGSYIYLRFDTFDPNQCYLQVSSHDPDWVEASFSMLDESLQKQEKRYGWSRSQWFDCLLQIFGVILAFAFSSWAAFAIANNLPMENAFIIIFLMALIVFSNVWGYIKNLVQNFINRSFPNIGFYRPDKDRHRWISQAVIGTILGAISLYFIDVFFHFVGEKLLILLAKGL